MAMTISGDAGITFPNASTQTVSATTLGYQTAAEVTASATTVVNNLSLGVGQTWQIVARTSGVTYFNTTGKPILFNGSVPGSSSPTLIVNGVVAASTSTTAGTGAFISAVIPPNASYSYTSTLNPITELR